MNVLCARPLPATSAAQPPAPTPRQALLDSLEHYQTVEKKFTADIAEQQALLQASRTRRKQADRMFTGGMVVAGLGVAGILAGTLMGGYAAVPGVLVTFAGLGLSMHAGNVTQDARLTYASSSRRAEFLQQLMENRILPGKNQALQALEADEAVQRAAVQSLAEGLKQVGQLYQDDSAVFLPGVRLKKHIAATNS